jgi:hypothetical protein
VVGGLPHGIEVGFAVSDVELNLQDGVAVGVDKRVQSLEVASPIFTWWLPFSLENSIGRRSTPSCSATISS